MAKDKAAAKTGKATVKKDAPKQRDPNGLTENEVKVLTALSKAGGKPMSRADLSTKTGITKGWSRLLGAPTKGDKGAGGASGDRSLEARRLVQSHQPDEGERGFRYTITAAGKQALTKVK